MAIQSTKFLHTVHFTACTLYLHADLTFKHKHKRKSCLLQVGNYVLKVQCTLDLVRLLKSFHKLKKGLFQNMPGSLHILVTSFFVFWLFRTTKIIFYICLLTHFARSRQAKRKFKYRQNHATKMTKIQKKKRSYENDMSQTIITKSRLHCI